MKYKGKIYKVKSYKNNYDNTQNHTVNSLRLDKIELKMDKIIGMLYDLLRLGR